MRKKISVLFVAAIAIALILTACTVEVTLTFEVDGEVYASVETTGREAIQMPQDPAKEGYIFDGWYWDKDVWEQPFTVNSLLEMPLSSNMTVYAKWEEEPHVHTYGEWTVVTPATCTAEGQKKRVCSCGTEETEVIPKVAHTYGEWTVVTQASCTAEGQKKRVCSVCFEEETEAIQKLPHTYETKHDAVNHWEECSVGHEKINVTAHTFGEWTVVTPATCTAEGQKKHVCSCGAEETAAIPKLRHTYETKYNATNHWEECSVCQEKINVTAHTFGQWTVVTQATCTAEGQKKHTCTVCNAEGTAAIPKLEHNYVTKHDATNHWQECSVGHEKINVTAHTFGQWTVVTQATCTAEGQKKRVCSCGTEETAAIPKLSHIYETKYDATNHWEECSVGHEKINVTAHTFGQWTVVTQATCTAEGQKKRVCACGAEETAAIPKLSHIYETKYDATNHWEECSVGHEKINVTAHTFGDWSVVTAATCTTEGQKKRVCSCGAEETATIPKLAHTYETKHDATNHWEECSVGHEIINVTPHTFGKWTVVTAATCTAEGLKKRVCACGADETAAIPKLEHNYETKYDATNHWEECTVGHETINVTAHSFGAWEVITPATCTVAGEKKHVCTVCPEEQTEAIPKLEHNYVTKHDATNHWQECSVGHEIINVTAHTYGDWTVVTQATCAAEGLQKRTCSVCGTEETAVIEKLPHSNTMKYDDTNHWSECSVCGETSNPEAHTYVNDVCTVCQRVYGTQGLAYTRITNGYSVSGIGTAASNAKIEIPSLYEGEPVTEIGSNAFENCSFTAIEIPNSVTSIGSYAFYNCGSFQSIILPNGLTSISARAFYGCGSLIIYAEAVEKPSGWDGNWNSLNYPVIWDHNNNDVADDGYIYTIQNGIRYGIKDGAAVVKRQPINITEANIASEIIYKDTRYSVTSIGDWAFQNCSSLQSIAIPNGVTSISRYAFRGCSSLQSIAIPNSVTSIGDNVFDGCSSLTNIVIPNGVTSIGGNAFAGCNSLQSIAIPNSVTSIGGNAFAGCNSLQSITIPNGVTSIGDWAFQNCSSLQSITIPNGVTSIGTATFDGCTGLKSIVIPDTVTSIGEYAFQNCGKLTNIVIPNRVTSIGAGAFSQCSALQSIVIPQSVTSIDYFAFQSCSSLQSITIPNGVTSIGYSAFQSCSSLQTIVIPNSVTSIDSYAFQSCSSLQNIEYQGTKAEWKAITKKSNWNYSTGNYTVTCTDGTLSKAEA